VNENPICSFVHDGVGCCAFARRGHATCAGHDPELLARLESEHQARVAHYTLKVRERAAIVRNGLLNEAQFIEAARDLRHAVNQFLKEVEQ
jgi:hypothetical protein